MGVADQETKQKLPFPYDAVYRGLVYHALPGNGFRVKSMDPLTGRIAASAGMSLFSFGENLALILERIDESNTLLTIQSSLKLGMNLAGAHRHHKNFDTIITALSSWLRLNERWAEEVPDTLCDSRKPGSAVYVDEINEPQTAECCGDVCENCGRIIGKLETPHLWHDHIVCAACRTMLEQQ